MRDKPKGLGEVLTGSLPALGKHEAANQWVQNARQLIGRLESLLNRDSAPTF